tara:strand:+ start:273 stop:476 length:204 start_codon:yes stop_codon:yes gene_type:complete
MKNPIFSTTISIEDKIHIAQQYLKDSDESVEQARANLAEFMRRLDSALAIRGENARLLADLLTELAD